MTPPATQNLTHPNPHTQTRTPLTMTAISGFPRVVYRPMPKKPYTLGIITEELGQDVLILYNKRHKDYVRYIVDCSTGRHVSEPPPITTFSDSRELIYILDRILKNEHISRPGIDVALEALLNHPGFRLLLLDENYFVAIQQYIARYRSDPEPERPPPLTLFSAIQQFITDCIYPRGITTYQSRWRTIVIPAWEHVLQTCHPSSISKLPPITKT